MIPVRCSVCKRVRFHTPGAGIWTLHPEPIPGEVTVLCHECVEARDQVAAEAKRIEAGWA
jgi:hypothetical protein